MRTQKTLAIGDHIELSGGYDFDPLFLKYPPSDKRTGTVINFIAGRNNTKAAVVRLNGKIKGEKIRGNIVVLELRYVDQTWDNPSPVHIELCDFVPGDKPSEDGKRGEWIEGAATLRVIK